MGRAGASGAPPRIERTDPHPPRRPNPPHAAAAPDAQTQSRSSESEKVQRERTLLAARVPPAPGESPRHVVLPRHARRGPPAAGPPAGPAGGGVSGGRGGLSRPPPAAADRAPGGGGRDAGPHFGRPGAGPIPRFGRDRLLRRPVRRPARRRTAVPPPRARGSLGGRAGRGAARHHGHGLPAARRGVAEPLRAGGLPDRGRVGASGDGGGRDPGPAGDGVHPRRRLLAWRPARLRPPRRGRAGAGHRARGRAGAVPPGGVRVLRGRGAASGGPGGVHGELRVRLPAVDGSNGG